MKLFHWCHLFTYYYLFRKRAKNSSKVIVILIWWQKTTSILLMKRRVNWILFWPLDSLLWRRYRCIYFTVLTEERCNLRSSNVSKTWNIQNPEDKRSKIFFNQNSAYADSERQMEKKWQIDFLAPWKMRVKCCFTVTLLRMAS